MEIRIEACALGCLDNLIGATINAAGASTIHLLTDYAADSGITLTADKALIDPDFLRYAVQKMKLYKTYLRARTSIFNLGGKRRHTPADKLHVVALGQFVTLPKYEEVAFWQGAGTGFALADVSKIDVVAVVDESGTTANVSQSYVVAVMFDEDACGVLQPRKRVTTQYNPKIEAYNDFHKWESRYFNDLNEQCVVFVLD